ncbi:hypothetical protein GUJ93_ZPchr0001g33024 [Zizania palustris]|uniref:Uncharacterized protein n=1 Tax=Zizania palustris TaxID=103762 RepID=A0A8J5RSV6_ZIZPA|nr:hypothetical protein GUJ93_ZPchr0001g33024 [Zizania palustris]
MSPQSGADSGSGTDDALLAILACLEAFGERLEAFEGRLDAIDRRLAALEALNPGHCLLPAASDQQTHGALVAFYGHPQ